MKKIFILLGHPDKESLSGIFADVYEREAQAAGHEVRRANIGELQFDPILHHGYKVMQQLEPDLVTTQENITWSEHFVIVYPNWWGSMPAIFKGFWDRALLPRFAFHVHKSQLAWDKLLKGRTARVIILCGNPPFLDWFAFGRFTNTIKRSILEFSGFDTKITSFGRSEHITDAKKAKWERKIAALARKGI